MKKVMMAVSLLFLLGGCQSAPSQPETETQDETVTETDTENDTVNETETVMEENEISEVSEKEEMTMILKINDQKIDVNWEDNESVTALEQLVSDKALTISMSMFGGWEQVGSIGAWRYHAVFRQSDCIVLRKQFMGIYKARIHAGITG